MSLSQDFYRDLPEASSLEELFRDGRTQAAPADWELLMTDVVGSTAAIQAGRYKDVNTAGGLAAMAVGNALGSLDFPFVFGGDGVTLLLPPDQAALAADVLVDTRRQVRAALALDLRVGRVPVAALLERGHHLHVGRLRVSPQYCQAVLDGDGVAAAEALIKDPAGSAWRLEAPRVPSLRADFSGFTCRWKDIPSRQGEVISLIVEARASVPAERHAELATVLEQVAACYGDEASRHPVRSGALRLAGAAAARREALLLRSGKGPLGFAVRWLSSMTEMAVVAVVSAVGWSLRWRWLDLSRPQESNARAADVGKYDGSLKMVLAGDEPARLALQAWLETRREDGALWYGLHRSDRALMTCLLHAQAAGEVHFVDAADGGYALAAKMLKAQRRAMASA